MRKVLLVANIQHAFTRVFALGAYLPEFGWKATVLTPPMSARVLDQLGAPRRFLENTKIMEAPYRGDVFRLWRKLLLAVGFAPHESIVEQIKARTGMIARDSPVDVVMRWYQTIFAYPDTERTWRGAAIRAGSRALDGEPFDVIMSSSPFPTSHIVAAALKKRSRLPWLADFRDPWARNHNYPYGALRRRFEERLERQVLRDADLITAATPGVAKTQQDFHGRPALVIPVGFDPETVNVSPMALTEKFTMTYTGTIYPAKQDPEKLLVALRRLVDRGTVSPQDIEVRFYGRRQHWLDSRIADLGLSGMVRQGGQVSRGESLRRQRESQLLLLLNWEDPEAGAVYPLKLFEYLAAQRPVLASGGRPQDDVASILRETGAGVYAPTVERVEEAIATAYHEYKRTGQVGYAGTVQVVHRYSYTEAARRFAEALDAATRRAGGGGREG